jgi:Na+-transporting NADH:ubiquinone oxidoreductase subunit NqrC
MVNVVGVLSLAELFDNWQWNLCDRKKVETTFCYRIVERLIDMSANDDAQKQAVQEIKLAFEIKSEKQIIELKASDSLIHIDSSRFLLSITRARRHC